MEHVSNTAQPRHSATDHPESHAGSAQSDHRGLFLTFEGIDGTGKSTQIRRVTTLLRQHGHEVVATCEPGGTLLGREIRHMLLSLKEKATVLPRTEALLYAADRAQHVDELVRPALERGAIVLSDRYIDSTIAYQGAGRDLTAHQIRRLSEWATGGLWPDRTYLFDMTPRAARERLLKNRGDNMDRLDEEPLDFQIKTRDEYFRLAAAEPKRFVMIDAAQTEDTVTQQLCADLAIYLHDPALAKDAQ